MTRYDKLIDVITNELYKFHISNDGWNEEEAKKISHHILEIVEEYQSLSLANRP
jgi:hypothetical protein